MIKRLKLSNRILVSSDHHFAHDKPFIVGKRGFKTIKEHDKTLIENWNNTVNKNDTVIYLGDFSVGEHNTLEYTLEILEKLNGKIYYIFGNHETQIFKIYHRAVRQKYGEVMNGFEIYPIVWNDKITFVGNSLFFTVNKQMFYARHMAPMIWDHIQHDSICLCGHSHSNCEALNAAATGQKILDCGVDNYPAPILLSDVVEICKDKKYIAIDHHED